MAYRKRLKKPEQVRAEFERNGVSISAWAREHGVSRSLVSEVLAGSAKRRCVRGQSHRIAVLLGLKEGVLVDRPSALNAAVAA